MKRLKIFFILKFHEVQNGFWDVLKVIGMLIGVVLFGAAVTLLGLFFTICFSYGLAYIHINVSISTYEYMLPMCNNEPFLVGAFDLAGVIITGFVIFLIGLFFKWIYNNWKYAGEIVNNPELLKYWEGDYD